MKERSTGVEQYPRSIRVLSWLILAAPVFSTVVFFLRSEPDAGSRPHFYWVNSSVLIAVLALFLLEKRWLGLNRLGLRKWMYYGLILLALFIPVAPLISVPIVSLIFSLLYVFIFAPMVFFVVPVIVIGCFFGAHPSFQDGRFSPLVLAVAGGLWNFWYLSHWT